MDVMTVHTAGLAMYIEGAQVTDQMRGGRMDDAAYAAMLDHTIIACTDAVIVDTPRRGFWLARRIVEPMRGLWWIGGRRMKGETPHEGMSRTFGRETGLGLAPERFRFRTVVEYLWASRAQEPTANGAHDLTHQFTVELTPQERRLVASNLNAQEYDRGFGLAYFDRARLLAEEAHPVILDLYDQVFPC